MADLCKPLNPLQRDGTSQRQRLVAALEPSYVSVDERDLSDLLIFSHKYAALLRYYTLSNSRGGDWVEFIEHDISTLVALIGDTDCAKIKTKFEDAVEAVAEVPAVDRPAAYAALFPLVLEVSKKFDDWYRDSIDGLSLRAALTRLIGSVLSDSLREVLSQAARAEQVGIVLEGIDPDGYSTLWELDEIQSDPSLFPSGGPPASEDDLLDAAGRLKIVFERFQEALVFLVDEAPSYFEKTLEDYPEHQPQIALFLAFLQIFEVAQDHLNTITAEHLRFYYQEVLRLEHRPQTPDQVHVLFELAKNASPHRVMAETLLKAGKDATGVDLLYSTADEIVVNSAKLDEVDGLKTIYVDKEEGTGIVKNVYAAVDADSSDGQGQEIEDEEGKWETFGSIDMPYASIGFGISSPLFLLAEGTRRARITLHFSSPLNLHGAEEKEVVSELRHNVRVSASGEKGWLDLEITDVEISDTSITYELELGAGEPAIVGYNDETLLAGFDATAPTIRFLLDNDGLSARDQFDLSQVCDVEDYSDSTALYDRGSLVRYDGEVYRALSQVEQGFRPPDFPDRWALIERSYPYKYFQGLELRQLEISVEVGAVTDSSAEGMKNLILENDVGVLDAAKPFFPFGPSPRSRSSFLIGSPEVFQKSLTELQLAIEWAGLPVVNFSAHYQGYTTPIGAISVADVSGNDDFKADLEILQDGQWVNLAQSQALFTPSDSTSAPDEKRDLSLELDEGDFGSDPDLEVFEHFGATLRQGFFRLKLTNDFLHSKYPRLLAQTAASGGTIPNAPYTPLMAGLTLSYRAAESIDFTSLSDEDFDHRVQRLFQITPFGQMEIFPIADEPAAVGLPIERKLIPEFLTTVKDSVGNTQTDTAEGTLYIGIQELTPPQNLALLFQVAEGSEDPQLGAQEIVWSYLALNQWIDFETTQILSDRTNGLLTSGVVKLEIPRAATAENSQLPAALHWVKASVANDSAAVPRLVDVRTQAVLAGFSDNGNDPNHLSQPLQADAIAKMKVRAAAIKGVSQPYASFGGRMLEQSEAFNIRVSERLRHKGRAITIFDYERLVLEEFPEVYKVKCINHTSLDCELDPGHVRLVVVPDLRNKNAVDPLRPRLSLNKLEEIRDYLSNISSDFVTIEVGNPEYEQLQVRFSVLFQPGRDKGLYTLELEQDIIEFLSPWLYDDVADLTFGGRIHRSWILNHVEELEYVDFVTDFRLDHIVTETVMHLDVEEALATSSSAALVSAPIHVIDHILSTCKDEAKPVLAPPGETPQTLPSGTSGYLGNVSTRELHDLSNLTAQCQIDEIAIDRRYHFGNVSAAKAMGYDLCAYCFSREESKR